MLTTPCRQGVQRSGLKKLGDSKAALRHCAARQRRIGAKKVMLVVVVVVVVCGTATATLGG